MLRRSGYEGRERALYVALPVSIDEKRPHVFMAAKVEYFLKVDTISLCELTGLSNGAVAELVRCELESGLRA
jgi:hypothetical protein